MAVWPSTLPQRFLADPGVQETPPDVVLETEMDAGPPKMRRRYTAGYRMVSGHLVLTRMQRTTLDNFFMTTLQGGSLTFDWKHPITGADATFRFLRGGLKFVQIQPDGLNLVWAELQLRIMP